MRARLPARYLAYTFSCMAVILFCGCLREKQEPLVWADFLELLMDPDQIARLDVPGAALISSTDPSGGDEDYNHFVRRGPRGWVVLADLKGPGVLTRLWLTGAQDGSRRLRFYMDGGWRPVLDMTLDELGGGREPFTAPLAAYENDAWYSLIPIPYRKRLIIMAEDGRGGESGWTRLAYHVGYTTLPRETRIRSFNGTITERDRERLDSLAQLVHAFERASQTPRVRVAMGSITLQPGESRWMDPIRGPGVIRRLTVTPKLGRIQSAIARQDILRDVILKIRWDKASAFSVDVPIGGFFGSPWNRTRYRAAFFSYQNESWACRFPMPFSTAAEITLLNSGIYPIEVEVEALWEPLPAHDERTGYFHATWSGSMPESTGRTHAVLDVQGRGKYVGCVVGTSSTDRDWRFLEGDEFMLVDGAAAPDWRGTALAHYFSLGRSYQGPVARPFHGTLARTFFGAIQYRQHGADAVKFDKSFQMFLERGSARSWMQSVAYYYLDRPVAAAFPLGSGTRQPVPQHPMSEATIMTELFDYERMGDYRGAREHIARYLERFPESRYSAVLRLRQIAYTEATSGLDAAWPLYQKFISEETDEQALTQAKLLAWFLEDPEHALIGLHSSGRSSAMLGGATVCAVEGPERMVVVGIKVKPGRHVLAVQSAGQPRPNWVQAALRMRKGMVSTQAGWKYAFDPSGNWAANAYDTSEWKTLDRTGTLAPPEEPFIWIEPNAFVGFQSVAAGLRPGDNEWPDRQSTVVFRREFDVQ